MLLAAVVGITAAPGYATAKPTPQTIGTSEANTPIELPDGGLLGTPSIPADQGAVARKRSALAAPAARTPIGGYTKTADALTVPPVGQRPYDTTTVTPVGGYGLVDSTGVRMNVFYGKTWNHPVGQSQYALANLNSYRLTGDPAYLDIAERNAQRLIDRRVESAGAWYYPYDFDFTVVGDSAEMLHAPWFSAMAQGQALSAFVRLFEVTNDAKWKTAADATFTSLAQAPSGALPSVTHVDAQKHLWLEEYPRNPAANGEEVLNGHIFAVYGLFDYWRLTGSPQSADLIRGGIATVQQTAMTGFRRVNLSSVYSLRHGTPANSYHQVHIDQLLYLWRFTHDVFFVNTATTFRNDYPLPGTTGQMQATPRTSTIYQINGSGGIIRSKRVSFVRNTQAPADHRQRLYHGPIAFRVSRGPYTNWWFPEGFGVTWLIGAKDTHTYVPQPTVYIEAGLYSAYRLDAAGYIAGSKTVVFPRRSSAPSGLSGIVQGRPAYYFAVGTYAGYWLPMQAKVHL